MDLICLNRMNGADKLCLGCCEKLLSAQRGHPLIGAEFGIAYGGGPQAIGRLWKPHGGKVYGFDTFEGHPKQLACSPTAMEHYAMDSHYANFGTDALSYDYQRTVLNEEGLDNVILRKGLIHDKSLDDVPYLDYCLLDMDFIVAMVLGWRIVSNKMAGGGYLCLHDVLPRGNITGLWGLYQEILADGRFVLVGEYPCNMLAIVQRKAWS